MLSSNHIHWANLRATDRIVIKCKHIYYCENHVINSQINCYCTVKFVHADMHVNPENCIWSSIWIINIIASKSL